MRKVAVAFALGAVLLLTRTGVAQDTKPADREKPAAKETAREGREQGAVLGVRHDQEIRDEQDLYRKRI